MMRKSKLLILLLIFLIPIMINVYARAEGSINFLLDVFNIEEEKADYFAKLNLSNEELSFVFYLYSNSNRPVTREEIHYIENHINDYQQFSIYFGMPPIMFEDGVIKLHHPHRQRIYPPLDTKKYEKKRKTKYEEEKLEIKGNKYEYSYHNKKYNVEEKIEIKKNKYDYYYKNPNMIEKLSVKYPNNKYEYYYKDLNTGRVIKKEGKGKKLDPELFYRQLKNEQQSNFGFKFDIKINF